MKIVLVAANPDRKNLVVTLDNLKAHSMEEAVQLTNKGELDDVHVVRTGAGSYVRANPNASDKDNLDVLSISSFKLFESIDTFEAAWSLPAFRFYWKLFQAYLKSRKDDGEHLILIDDRARTTEEHVREKLTPHSKLVFVAAEHFSIDPYLLGGIIVDEIARVSMFEDTLGALLSSYVGWNASAGVAQVKMETARGLIKDGYYNPNPSDEKLSKEKIDKTSRAYLFGYVEISKHSIYFAAARMRSLIDTWRPIVDISKKPEIIATLYSLGYRKPHKNPKPSDRGLQISDEFYRLAKDILNK